MAWAGITGSASRIRAAAEGHMAMASPRNCSRLPRRRLKKSGLLTTPTLMIPPWSGMNQNQPCSKRWMPM